MGTMIVLTDGSDTDAPLCATYTYPNNAKEFRCENSIGTNYNVDYTYSGFSTPIQLPREIAGYTTTNTNSDAYFPYASVITITQTPPSAAPTTTMPSSTTSSGSSSQTTSSSSASTSPTSQSSSGSSVPAGAIAGGVIGGIAVIAGIIAAFVWVRYRKRAAERAHAQASYSITGMPPQSYERKDDAEVSAGLMIHSSPVQAPVEAPGIYVDNPTTVYYASELPSGQNTWPHAQ